MSLLYNALLGIAFLLALPWFALGHLLGRKRHNLRHFRERLGAIPPVHDVSRRERSIWVHCVSVGEVLAARVLIRRLVEEHPERRVFVTTVTTAGREIAVKELGESVRVCHAPIDLPCFVRRACRRLRPALLVIVETELWPNLIRIVGQSGAAIALVNGRISDRSYPRYRRFARFFREVLEGIDLFLMQSEEDARRIETIGADASRVRVAPNLKWCSTPHPDPAVAAVLRDSLGIAANRRVLVAGSTCAGEEQAVLDAAEIARKRCPDLLVVLAPRKPNRFRAVDELLARSRVRYAVRTRSTREAAVDVILLDTIGELASVYGTADVAFIGGSLVDVGGHNPLEPAAWSRPVLFGPHMSNFRDLSRQMIEHGAARGVASAMELAEWTVRLVEDQAESQAMGRAGRALLDSFADSLEDTRTRLNDLLSSKGAFK